MSIEPSYTALTNAELLDKQLCQLIDLETIIDNEKNILQGQDPSQLNRNTENKNKLLLAIDSLDKVFATRSVFAEETKAGLYDEQLSKIKTILTRCKDKNTINGQIIEHSQLAIGRMKTSLLNQHNKTSMTYDSKGKTHGGLSSLGIKA